ncbi:MAG: monovalent cation/H+ antiporter subunit D family protein [Desulfotignum sp.]|nr:monovalent cation/H+ antiporter subunit D family protein [Desulfotignum sp.]MCF8126820.1 monovalent cation/H+ antiporter subunit D family protein [Desulfotignum sp.]
MNNMPAILVLAPLLGAFFAGLAAWIQKQLSYYIALAALAVSCVAAVSVLADVITSGTMQYRMAGWAPPMGIELRIDLLNAMVLVLISVIAFVNLVASVQNVAREIPDRAPSFYVMYLLFVVGLTGVTATGDLFNLYVLIEITSLTSYALIALGDKDRAPLAALNYIFIGVIGASFYLLGVGYLYITTGSLNMADVAVILTGIQGSTAVLTAFILCILGVWIKMALFPLHVWLPNAYAFAPVGFARVVAPLMTKVMVYVMVRLMVTVFGMEYIFETLHLADAVVWLAVIAILAGAFTALFQKDLKKMLAYIIVCEIGYMVGGAWLGNTLGMTGAILHILNDGLMTFALFLALGNIIYMRRQTVFSDLSGLFAAMPWTMAGFVLAGLSIIGVPPTCGFFSKWYLVLGAFEAGAYHFAAALIISSLVCAVLFFKVFEICFFAPAPGAQGHHVPGNPQPPHDIHTAGNLQPSHGHHAAGHAGAVVMAEAPVSMLAALGLVSASIIAAGVYAGTIVDTIILPFLQ